MKVEFIHKAKENSRLILIFTGWSAEPRLYANVSHDTWDVAVVYDYSDLTLPDAVLDGYYTVYVFAWSLGVFAAERTLDPRRITAAYAINGTPLPVSDTHGLPVEIFMGTADNLTPENLYRFRRRMMPDKETLNRCFPAEENAEQTEYLRKGLYTVASSAPKCASEEAWRLPWTRAYISANDRIFPPENMRRCWAIDPDVQTVETDWAHYTDIGLVIRSVIADTITISRHFSNASDSYDTHAIAQNMAAIRLASLIKAHLEENRKRQQISGVAEITGTDCGVSGVSTLEIGPGTGLFTKEYGSLLSPARAEFVDIADIPRFGVAPEEHYHKCDAELWLADEGEEYDWILSASAIQWFADIPRFLHECSRHLRPGGRIAMSTFLPGNMGELDEFRPVPLRYPGAAELQEWLDRDFEDILVEEDEIKVEFRSVRDMMMHLKHTGVTGSAPSPGLSISALRRLRTLTYRPVYFTAKAKVRLDKVPTLIYPEGTPNVE